MWKGETLIGLRRDRMNFENGGENREENWEKCGNECEISENL